MSVRKIRAREPTHSAAIKWDPTSVYAKQDTHLTKTANAYVSIIHLSSLSVVQTVKLTPGNVISVLILTGATLYPVAHQGYCVQMPCTLAKLAQITRDL